MRYTLFFFFCFVSLASIAKDIKIGFIDTNQVVTSLTKYKQSIELISSEFEPKKQELLDLFNHIELLRSKIDSIEKSNSNQSIQIELSKLSNLEQSFQKETEFWQKNMNNRKIDLLKEIELVVNQTINDYALKENFDLILYENIAFASDEVDITDEIIAEIEKL
jgi:outer membrane protein